MATTDIQKLILFRQTLHAVREQLNQRLDELAAEIEKMIPEEDTGRKRPSRTWEEIQKW